MEHLRYPNETTEHRAASIALGIWSTSCGVSLI